jgi:uncharacterized protein
MVPMQIENSFSVDAPPDRVFAFLLDVERVVACVPGAELTEVVDSDTFNGRVRVKVGPVTVSYAGTAHITARDEAARTTTLQAEAKETTGSGTAKATTQMSVVGDGDSSSVTLATDFTVSGRVAQFGRGIMEDVSRQLVAQMAECIRGKLEAGEGGADAAGGPGALRAAADDDSPPLAETEAPRAAPRPQVSPPPAPAPLDAMALARSVAADRARAIGPGPIVGVAVGLFAVYLLARRRRRRRNA